MISKFSKRGIATFALLATSFVGRRGRHPGQGRILQGPAAVGGVLLQLDRRLRRHQRRLRLGHIRDWDPAALITHQARRAGLVGGTLGYNWQSGAIVYGIEGDFD